MEVFALRTEDVAIFRFSNTPQNKSRTVDLFISPRGENLKGTLNYTD